jgi:hypothetical protein
VSRNRREGNKEVRRNKREVEIKKRNDLSENGREEGGYEE